MRKFFFAATMMFAALGAAAQNMFDYADIRKGVFRVETVRGLVSMNDGEHYTITQNKRIDKYSYGTGEMVEVIFDAADFKQLPKGFSGYEFSPDEKKILLTTNKKTIYRRSYTADHWVYDVASKKLTRLSETGAEQVPQFSPDGRKVAFVRENNIYCADVTAAGRFPITQVTTDGVFNEVINGHADWVYEEEMSLTRAFAFSPDGKRLAFLRFDESHVKEVTLEIVGKELYTVPYTYKYPKAGERNSIVTLNVYDFATARISPVDVGPETDQYIPRIAWTPDGKLYFCRTNRLQNHLDVVLADGAGSKIIYSESDKRYIGRIDDETVTFLPKGDRFIVYNETSGYGHLYLYDVKKGPVDTLTRGNWEVTGLVGVGDDRVYYLSTEGSPLRRNLWSVKLNGKGKTRLTHEEGTFTIAPSKGFKYFISYFSNTSTPNLVRLHNSSGKVVRTLEDNAKLQAEMERRKLPRKEFFQFTNDFGMTLNGYMIRPRDFDPAKKYPLMMCQYSGPGSQRVLDRWAVDWSDVLVQEGYIVACVDGRGTGGRGAEFRKCTYGRLGQLETEDQIAAARYLGGLEYVDAARIGIQGWSFGGYMALNCILKGADYFKMAISVAPVTSWRFYDTIYTELYNGLPQDNAAGYDDNSPLSHAKLLKGKLLIMHGTADDNVHIQNTYRMAAELVRAGKHFDMMVYPDCDHAMNPAGRHHIMQKMIDYTLKTL